MKAAAPIMFSVLVLACDPVQRPAPAVPFHEVHDDDAEPPKEGATPVAIDVADGQATVARVLESEHATAFSTGIGGVVSASAERTEPLCLRTPCIVNLPRGIVELKIVKYDSEGVGIGSTALKVGKKPITLIYEPPRHEDPSTGAMVSSMMLEGVGITGMVLGGTFLGLSQVPSTDSSTSHDLVVPAIVLGAGVGMLALGIVVRALGRGSVRPPNQTVVTGR